MTHYSLNIERVTPEIRKALEQLQALHGVTIVPDEGVKATSKWDEAIAEGAVTVDVFIGELRRRIDQWPSDNA